MTHAAPLVPSTRLTLALVAFIGIVMIYSCRVNLSVALVCMVNQTAIKRTYFSLVFLYNIHSCRRRKSVDLC